MAVAEVTDVPFDVISKSYVGLHCPIELVKDGPVQY